MKFSFCCECVPTCTHTAAHTPVGTGNTSAFVLVPTDSRVKAGQRTDFPHLPAFASSSSYQQRFFLVKKSAGSGLSSSVKIPARSKMRASGSGWNIWVCRGCRETVGSRLSQRSRTLYLIFFEVCLCSLMSTTVQIPETLLDFQNHIIVSQHAALRERERKESCFLENV